MSVLDWCKICARVGARDDSENILNPFVYSGLSSFYGEIDSQASSGSFRI